ncbi:helix-turn-helix domain-containing protein [Actinoplanes sp. NPDC049265]|uniref:helix-turn-helix domain-containing protein n=1 Tax=Actinoplanes sp. NPDC049265 TaxID=3363902 RepID=UPI00371F0641
MERNSALRDFLRARRAQVSPAEAGLRAGDARRVPGLRREEVAALAGVSVDYYMRLEQGRNISPSDGVLDALARALRLSPTQRSQLYLLVRGRRTGPPAAPAAGPPDVEGLLRAIAVPAIVVGRGTRVLGSNALHQALTTDFRARPPAHRFYAHWLFADPAAAAVMVGWEQSARETVGVVRAAATRFPDDDVLARLVDELYRTGPDFRKLWDEHDVAAPSSGIKTYRLPVLGELSFQHVATQLSDEVWMHLYWAEDALRHLRTSVNAAV